jgi:hypothetical protein
MYVEKSVYLGCGRGSTIGNLRLLWSKRALKASGQNSDFRKSEPDLQLRLRRTSQNSHTAQQVIAERDWSAQEVSHILLQLPV